MVQATPIKVSRPQALTVANLTQSQIQTLIQENPTRPSILRPSEQFLPPSIPLYLPDPERNKSTDEYYVLTTAYTQDESKSSSNEEPTKLKLPLDAYVPPPPPSLEDVALSRQVEQAEKDKQSYSYNNRFDYYFPVHVVYDNNQKYGEKELQLMELQPPNESSEPNYYADKPKKLPKKYRPDRKHKVLPDNDDGLVPIDNDGLVLEDEHNTFVTSQPVERFAPAPSFRQLSADDLNTGEYIPKYKQAAPLQLHESTAPSVFGGPASEIADQKQSGELYLSSENSFSRIGLRHEDEDDYNVGVGVRENANEIVDEEDEDVEDDEQNSPNEKRVQFQIHGFNGPNSYKFGYDTGLG